MTEPTTASNLGAETTSGRAKATSGDPDVASGYAEVNGLRMYHEIHGTGEPLVLLHGALSATQTSFGLLLPELAKTRRVIAVEQQAHGRTADVDRPLSYHQMAADTAAVLDQLGVANADFMGYSMGAGIVLELALRRPELVRKMVLISVAYSAAGFHPGILDGIEQMTPEALAGTPFEAEYQETAPNPDDWPNLIRKVQQLDSDVPEIPAETVASVQAPALVVLGDSDVIRPEHAVEIFRLFGGGVAGDIVGLPSSQLAILPGTTHITIVNRADLLLPMLVPFLDAPVPSAE